MNSEIIDPAAKTVVKPNGADFGLKELYNRQSRHLGLSLPGSGNILGQAMEKR